MTYAEFQEAVSADAKLARYLAAQDARQDCPQIPSDLEDYREGYDVLCRLVHTITLEPLYGTLTEIEADVNDCVERGFSVVSLTVTKDDRAHAELLDYRAVLALKYD